MRYFTKRFLAVLLAVLTLAMTVPAGVVTVLAENTTEFLGGDGTEENPYLISDKTHLNNVRRHLDAHFKMVADIEFTEADFAEGGKFYRGGQGWEPIGSYSTPFSGVFDGNGHIIKALYENLLNESGGLFSANTGTIRNIHMVESQLEGHIDSSYSGSRICVGSIVGLNLGNVIDCSNSGMVFGLSLSNDINGSVWTGGIAGENRGVISYCQNTGTVKSLSKGKGIAQTGGITACLNNGTIENCSNTGIVAAECGKNSYLSDNTYAYAGGIVAELYGNGSVYCCFNTGLVDGRSSLGSVGGIAGRIIFDSNRIENCYNAGRLSSLSEGDIGGIVGAQQAGNRISHCYSLNWPKAENSDIYQGVFYSNVGGIAGQNDGESAYCYYQEAPEEEYNNPGGSPIGESVTLEQLRRQETFENFDFTTIWTLGDNEDYPFPTLRNTPHNLAHQENTDEFSGGDGTSDNPFQITNTIQFDNIRLYPYAHFILMDDLVFSSKDFAAEGDFYNDGSGWIPIGNQIYTGFTGVLDGNGHTVSGLVFQTTIKSTDDEPQFTGLFGINYGIIKNLSLSVEQIKIIIDWDSSYSGNLYSGGIAGYNNGDILACEVTGKTNIDIEAYSKTTEEGEKKSGITYFLQTNIGGITGKSSGCISRCSSRQQLNVSFVASNLDKEVLMNSSPSIGGIAGFLSGKVDNCYSDCKISYQSNVGGTDQDIGSIAGTVIDSIVSHCFTTGANCSAIGLSLSGKYESCYYLGAQPALLPSGIYACPIKDAYTQEDFPDLDFDSIWMMEPAKYLSLPILQTFSDTIVASLPENTVEFAGGSGDIRNPYRIRNTEQLNHIRLYPHAWFRLEEDIYFTEADFTEGGAFYNNGQGWEPIGSPDRPFKGVLDGQGHVISGLHIEKDSSDNTDTCAGLFGYSLGLLQDIHIENAMIQIKNTYISPENKDVFKKIYIGGLAGYIVQVNGCSFNGSVIIDLVKPLLGADHVSAGGVAGYGGVVQHCWNSGNIAVIGGSIADTANHSNTGGVVGKGGNVSFCYNLGEVSANVHGSAGGVVGDIQAGYYSLPSIFQCYNAGTVSGAFRVGGVVGCSYATPLVNCYNSGTVILNSREYSDSFNPSAGGISGYSSNVVENCYNVGSIQKENPIRIGDLYGIVWGETKNCYYLDNVECGAVEGTAVKCTAEQMMQQETFVGFDFDTIWTMAGNTDYLSPELKDVPLQFKKELESIEIFTLPTKLSYLEGDEFDPTGLAVTAYYNNGTSEIVTEYEIDGYDSSPGVKTITVTYQGKTTTFKVEVFEYTPGDLNGDNSVTDVDAIHLLYHTLLPDLYPINQSADYNGDGKVTDADAIYLLYYTLLPDLYPLH